MLRRASTPTESVNPGEGDLLRQTGCAGARDEAAWSCEMHREPDGWLSRVLEHTFEQAREPVLEVIAAQRHEPMNPLRPGLCQPRISQDLEVVAEGRFRDGHIQLAARQLIDIAQ